MIFVTVGSHHLPFNRLMKWIDSINLKTEVVIIQAGTSTFLPKKAECISYISYGKMIQYIKKANLVITHAGPATLHLIWQYHPNLPIVVPRVKRWGEHVSDHQLYYADYLQQRQRIHLVKTRAAFKKAIKQKPRRLEIKTKKNGEQLAQKLNDYINSTL